MLRSCLLSLCCVIGLWAQSASAELSIEGPCAQDYRWTATMINQGGGGIATYNECFPSGDLFYMQCAPGGGAVEITIEFPFAGLGAQDALTAELVAGSNRLPLQGSAIYSEMLGAAFPVFTASRNDPIFAALRSESSASITLGQTTFSMHLAGSSDIITAMFEACP